MSALAAGFADPVLASQAVFRAVMDAMARPGSIEPIRTDLAAPPPLSAGFAAVALALVDYETSVWLDPPLAAAPDVAQWLRFHAGAPVTQRPDEAAFAFIADARAMPAFDSFALGTMEYPDRSTTVVVQVESFAHEKPFTISGPGILGERLFGAVPLPDRMPQRLAANRALFPRGIDFLFVTAEAVVALPRSTWIMRKG